MSEAAPLVSNQYGARDTYADDEWHHVVATREGDVARIYIDSLLVKEDVAMAEDIGGDKTRGNGVHCKCR